MHASRSCLLLACAALGACRGSAPPPTETAYPGADSIVLERTRCFGSCPAYRLGVSAAGDVAFTSRGPEDEGRTHRARVPPEAFRSLVTAVARSGFIALPDTVAADPALCPLQRTDSPTATVTVFARSGSRQVVDYQGCAPPADPAAARRVAALRGLEAAIDSVAGSERWVRPAPR
ncbi:MAG TPA: DUF6438 domain-containing protein [Longimicrobiaceae bacterium]|jgi:hypothetical protein